MFHIQEGIGFCRAPYIILKTWFGNNIRIEKPSKSLVVLISNNFHTVH